MPPAFVYLLVRAALFVVPFAVLMVAQVPAWLSLAIAIVFAFSASIVFFPRLRARAAADVQRMREGRKFERAEADDADIEDAALDDRSDRSDADDAVRTDESTHGEDPDRV